MRKTKKIVALGLIAAMAMGVMAGCAKQGAQGTAQTGAQATKYPEKPIQIVVPAGPGGDTDTNARLVAKYMEKSLGKSVIVSNMEGAGGSLGTKNVKDAKPDGYTVLFFHPSMIINKIFGVADYDFSEFEQGPMVTQEPGNAIYVGKNSKYNTLKDLVDDAKANPGKISYAIENGGLQHMMGMAFAQSAGIKLNFVDIGGQAAKNTALLGGQVNVSPGIVGNAASYVKSGDMKILGIFAGQRQDAYKDVPTLKEQGVDVDLSKPYFFLFPKGTPKEVVDKFDAAVKAACGDAGLAKDFEKFFIKPDYKTPAETKALLEKQRDLYKKLYDASKK
jgi:tripartite-type tricarboxylate transporter receptor subunit TctC